MTPQEQALQTLRGYCEVIKQRCQKINPAIRYVYIEVYSTGYVDNTEIFAQSLECAWKGVTEQELYDDIRKSMASEEAA